MKYLGPLFAIMTSICLLSSIASSAQLGPSSTNVYIPDDYNAYIFYYDISGSTKEKLLSQLHMPYSQTTWHFTWTWDYDMGQDGNCQTYNEDVVYKADISFPRWIPPKNASQDLIAEWETFIKALAEHEMGHVHIVHEGKTLIQTALRGSDCDDANQKAYDALHMIQENCDRYDKTTYFGATQGAIFPPLDSVSLNKLREEINKSINASNAALASAMPKKTASERFAELNKIKQNNTT